MEEGLQGESYTCQKSAGLGWTLAPGMQRVSTAMSSNSSTERVASGRV